MAAVVAVQSVQAELQHCELRKVGNGNPSPSNGRSIDIFGHQSSADGDSEDPKDAEKAKKRAEREAKRAERERRRAERERRKQAKQEDGGADVEEPAAEPPQENGATGFALDISAIKTGQEEGAGEADGSVAGSEKPHRHRRRRHK